MTLRQLRCTRALRRSALRHSGALRSRRRTHSRRLGRHRQRRHRRRGQRTERARGRRLGDRRNHRSADPLHQDRGDRRSGPLRHPRSAARRTTRSGCAATAWSIPTRSKASPASTVNLTAKPAPTPKAAAEIYPAIYWYAMLKSPEKSEFPDRQRARARPNGSTSSRPTAASPATRSATRRRATIPKVFADMKPEEAWTRRIHVRPGHDQHGDLDRPHRHAGARSSCSPTGPTASPRANCRRSSRSARKARSATSSSRSGTSRSPTHYLHDVISTDKRKPTVNANGLIYGAPENSTDFMPVLDPGQSQGDAGEDAGARSEDADVEGRSDVAVAVLGRRGDLGQPDQHAQPDAATRRAGSGSPRASAPRPIRTSARRAPIIRRRRCSRSIPRTGISRCSIRKPERSR